MFAKTFNDDGVDERKRVRVGPGVDDGYGDTTTDDDIDVAARAVVGDDGAGREDERSRERVGWMSAPRDVIFVIVFVVHARLCASIVDEFLSGELGHETRADIGRRCVA